MAAVGHGIEQIAKSMKGKEHTNRDAFTLAELLVAVGIFIVLVTIAVGVFIQSLKAQRVLAHTMAIHNNAGAALEQIAREIRTGYRFCAASRDVLTPGPCNEETDMLTFINYEGKEVTYALSVDVLGANPLGTLERTVTTPSGPTTAPITAPDVDISYLRFLVTQDGLSGTEMCAPWRIMIFMGVRSTDLSVTARETVLQTTMSSRILPGEAPEKPFGVAQTCQL